MEKGKSQGDAGRSESPSGTDILARIRATAAAKPETKIRTLTEENRQLQLALSISQAEVERLKEEQEALAEAYTTLEREGGGDKVKALKKGLATLEKERDDAQEKLEREVEKLTLASAALEMERDTWRSTALNPQPMEELNEKDTSAMASRTSAATGGADQMSPARRQTAGLRTGQSHGVRLNTTPHRQEQGYYRQWDMDDPAPNVTGGFMSRVQATLMPTPEQQIQRLKDDVRQLNKQLDEADTEIQAYRYHYNNLARAFQHAELEQTRFKDAILGPEEELKTLRKELEEAQARGSSQTTSVVDASS